MASPRLLELDDPAWLGFVERRPEATPFHHPAWSRVLAEAYGLRGFALALTRGSELHAGLPVLETRSILGRRRLVSLPFTDASPPLADAADLPALVDTLDGLARGARNASLEVRADLPGARVRAVGYRHVLPLGPDAQAVRRTFSRSQVQRNISRAEREGVTVREGRQRDDLLRVFYRLHLRTRRRQGVPIQPRRFFELLWDRMLAPGLGTVLVAELDGAPLAAAVFLDWNGTVVYKFGASDDAAWPRRPNHALFWHAIRSACERGRERLDFGRTDPGNEGLRAFKAGWGTTEEPLRYSVIGDPAPAGGRGRAAAVLGVVIRRSPPALCRLLGERLYRYAG